MRRGTWAAALAALLALAGCGNGAGGEPARAAAAEKEGEENALAASLPVPGTLPQGVSAETAEQGKNLYAASCIVCHGPEGEGTQLGPPLADGEWIHLATGAYPEMVDLVRAGVAEPEEFPVPMHPYGEILSEEEVRAVTAYAYSLRRL